MSTPLISIIVPVYNVSRYIERCARSLFEQSLNDIEYIFVDDCSPDNSIEILHQILSDYPSRMAQVKIISHEKNRGVAAARNTGLKLASGEFIAQCDSDDWVERDMYERMLLEAKRTSADLVACDFIMEYGTYSQECNEMPIIHDKINQLKNYIAGGWTVVWNKLAHRNLYFNNDIYAYEGWDFCEDYGLSVRLLACAESYSCIHTPLYHYNRANVDSIVRTYFSLSEKHTESQIQIYTKINHWFIERELYSQLEQVLSWRILCAKRGWLYDSAKYDSYLRLFPESNKWIDSNPLCSKKDKLCQHVILLPYLRWVISIISLFDKFIKRIK